MIAVWIVVGVVVGVVVGLIVAGIALAWWLERSFRWPGW